jgi:glycosyltransferase involved in cell wall biosynthesis
MTSSTGVDLPSITIVTPSFNQGKFIERTIQSVIGQQYPNLEHIVVDGGSTDETLSILKSHEDSLRWISEKDSGQSEAINKGFRRATGEILGWLNSDDTLLPDALLKVGRHFADHPDVMMVFGEGYMIDENDTIKSRFPFTEPKFDLWKLIYYGDYILQQSTFFRKSVFDSIPLLDESLHYGMDWDLFIRIGKRFRVDYLPEYLGCIREHGEAKTSTGGRRRFEEILGLVRKHGYLRYPPAYFNYGWDTMEKSSAASGSSLWSRMWTVLMKFAKWIGQKLLPLYLKRIEQGLYADGWVGKNARLVLPNLEPGEKNKHLSIKGEVTGPTVPQRIQILVNNRKIHRFDAKKPGTFEMTVGLPEEVCSADSYHVTIRSSKAFVPSRQGGSADNRELGFLLRLIEIRS